MKKPVIFCDFDGTITNSDNIIAIMKQFAPPEWDSIKNDILAQSISVKSGVGRMFSLLPSSQKEDITNYVIENAVIRDGFKEFVSFTKENHIPLYIISGGIDFFVEPLLKGLIPSSHIYCNKADFSNENIDILWPHQCDEHCENDCGCCKPTLFRNLVKEDEYKLVIGDSITDLQVAKLADEVIARDFLLQKCQQLNLTHSSFSTFFDVMKIIKKRMEVVV